MCRRTGITNHFRVFTTFSRINHSCMGNVAIMPVDGGEVGRSCLVATRDIKANEEILISYVRSGMPVAERRERLQMKYKFDCECDLCAAGKDGEEDTFTAEFSAHLAGVATGDPKDFLAYGIGV